MTPEFFAGFVFGQLAAYLLQVLVRRAAATRRRASTLQVDEWLSRVRRRG